MRVFDWIIDLISHSRFYVCYMSQWPSPFNIVSFDAVCLILFLFIGIKEVLDAVISRRNAAQFREKQHRIQEKREEQRKRDENNEIIKQYVRFLSVASAHNILGSDFITLEEFRLALQDRENEAAEAVEQDEDAHEHDRDEADLTAEEPMEAVSADEKASGTDLLEKNADPDDEPGTGEAENDEEEDKSINPAGREESEEDDAMSETEFSRIMSAIARKENAKKEAREQEDEKRRTAERKMAVLDNEMSKTVIKTGIPA